MTYVFEKTFGKFDSSTNFEGNKLIVEYCFSSVDECIKIVEMTRIGANEFGEIGENFHRMNWMSKEGQASLMEDLENDYLDNHSTSRTRQGLLSDGEMNFLRNNLLNSFDADTWRMKEIEPHFSCEDTKIKVYHAGSWSSFT